MSKKIHFIKELYAQIYKPYLPEYPQTQIEGLIINIISLPLPSSSSLFHHHDPSSPSSLFHHHAHVYSASNHKEGWQGNRSHRWCRSLRKRRVRSAPSDLDKKERAEKKVVRGRPTTFGLPTVTVASRPTVVGRPTVAGRPTQCIISTKIFK